MWDVSSLDLALTSVACALWYIWPALGPWPLLLLAAGRLLRTLTLGRSAWRPTPFDGPLLLFGITAIVGALLAYDPIAGWGKFWVIVGGLAFYDSLARGPQTVRVAGRTLSPPRLALAVLPAVIAAYFLLTTDWTRWLGKLTWLDPLLRGLAHWLPALPGHRLHPNVAGGLIAGLLPLQVAAIGRRRAGWPLIGLAAFCLLTTASRGAWIALAAVAALWLAWRLRGRRWPRGAWPALLAGTAVIGVGGAVIVLQIGPALFPGGRLELLRNSLDLALDTPFTGLGLASFQMAYSSYVLMLHVGHTFHSHNLLLDLWIEQGAVGLAAFAWLIGVGWREAIVGGRSAGVRGEAATDGRRWQGAALSSLGVILLHGLVDDAFYGSRGGLLLFAPFAALAQASPPTPSLGRRGGRGVRLLVASCLVLALALLPGTRAAFQVNLGALLQTRTELSVYRWPEYPIQDAVRRAHETELRPAMARYAAALALDPANAAANRRLGQIELSLGAYDAAQGHLAAAYAAAPGQQAVRFLAGESAALAGQTVQAAALWATVGDPQWRAGAGRQAFDLRAWWYGAVGEPVHQQRIELAIGQLTTAR